jgi:hypothetical protein
VRLRGETGHRRVQTRGLLAGTALVILQALDKIGLLAVRIEAALGALVLELGDLRSVR